MPYTDVFVAPQSRTRQRIINQIRMGPKSVAEIAAKVPVSRPAVSQQLQILLDAKLVSCERRGTRNFYRLERKGWEDLEMYVDGILHLIDQQEKKLLSSGNSEAQSPGSK